MIPMRTLLKNLLLAGLLLTALAACGAKDGDLTPPDVAFDGGGAGFSPTRSTSATLTGTKSVDATIDVEINTAASVVNLLQDATTWSCDVAGLVEGVNTIYVTATDPVGNNRQLQITIVVDLTGPVVTIDQYQTPVLPGLQVVAGTVSELGSSVAVDVQDSNGLTVLSGVTAAVDGHVWSADIDLSGQPDDIYTVTATGTDSLGNISTYPVSKTVQIDNATPAPLLTVTSPALPAISADTAVSLNGTVDPACALTVNGLPVSVTAGSWGPVDAAAGVNGVNIATIDACDGGSVVKALLYKDAEAPQVLDASRFLTAGDSVIDVDFGEEMSATIDVSNLTLLDETETPVTVATAELLAGNRTYRFTTSLPLAAGTYTATLQTTDVASVADLRGNLLAAAYTWKIRVN